MGLWGAGLGRLAEGIVFTGGSVGGRWVSRAWSHHVCTHVRVPQGCRPLCVGRVSSKGAGCVGEAEMGCWEHHQ